MSKPTTEIVAERGANVRSAPCGWAFVWLIFGGIALNFGCGSFPSSHNTAGVQLYQQGQMTAAMQQFQQALLAEPQNADAYYNLAATYHRMGSQQNDRQAFANALDRWITKAIKAKESGVRIQESGEDTPPPTLES